MKRYIMITSDFIGFHRWDEAPLEVAFLRTTHRHKFNVKLMISVNHEDRELEFFIIKRVLDEYLQKNFNCERYWECKYPEKLVGSCEMIAEKILQYFSDCYPEREMSVEVWEDGENGALVIL